MTIDEAQEIIDEAHPTSIERARKLLRKKGCSIDGSGGILLLAAKGETCCMIEPDPLAPAGMAIVEGKEA